MEYDGPGGGGQSGLNGKSEKCCWKLGKRKQLLCSERKFNESITCSYMENRKKYLINYVLD